MKLKMFAGLLKLAMGFGILSRIMPATVSRCGVGGRVDLGTTAFKGGQRSDGGGEELEIYFNGVDGFFDRGISTEEGVVAHQRFFWGSPRFTGERKRRHWRKLIVGCVGAHTKTKKVM